MKRISFTFLYSPWAIIAGIAAGIITGIYWKAAVSILRPAGELYLSVLQMCVIPVMVSAVVMSIGKLVNSQEAGPSIRKIIKVFGLFVIAISIISIIIGACATPFIASDPVIKKAIGKAMLAGEVPGAEQANFVIREIDSRFRNPNRAQETSLIDFLINIIPRNIFTALAGGDNFKILFFFILFGITMKFIARTSSQTIILLFEGIFEAFQKIIKIALYFLPFGLYALMAVEFSRTGILMLASFMKLIVLIYLAALIIFGICCFIFWRHTKGSFRKQFQNLQDVILICLGARNSFAAIPSAITGLVRGFHLDENRVNLAAPLGVTLCRHGTIILFAIASLYAAQLYGYRFRPEDYLILTLMVIFTATAVSGAPSVISQTMIGMILTPFGIPAGAVIVILMAIDPLIDPVITLMNVYPNCTATALIAGDSAIEKTTGMD